MGGYQRAATLAKSPEGRIMATVTGFMAGTTLVFFRFPRLGIDRQERASANGAWHDGKISQYSHWRRHLRLPYWRGGFLGQP